MTYNFKEMVLCIPSTDRGLTAPPASHVLRWNAWSSWRRASPLPRVHLVRSAGCIAPQSQRRDALMPTPRQQGVDGAAKKTGTPSWHLGQAAEPRLCAGYGAL